MNLPRTMLRLASGLAGVWLAGAGCGRGAADLHAANALQLLEQGRYERAVLAADLAVAARPDDLRIRDVALRARLTALVANLDQAHIDAPELLDYQAEVMLQRDPARACLYATVRGAVASAAAPQRAEELFRSAIKADAACVPARLGLALLLRASRRDEAEALLGEAVKLDPAHAPSLVQLGRLALEKGEYDKALALLEKAVAVRGDGTTRLFLAAAYWNRQRPREAGEQLQQAAAQEPRNAQARLELGNWLQATGRAEEALDQYLAASQLGAEPAATHARARLLLERGDAAEAARLFDLLATTPPRQERTLYDAAVAWERLGDSARAVERLQRYLALPAADAERERIENARARLQRLLAQSPKR